MMSRDTLQVLLKMLDSTSLQVADPQFERTAALVMQAKRELANELAALDAPAQPSPPLASFAAGEPPPETIDRATPPTSTPHVPRHATVDEPLETGEHRVVPMH